MIWSGKALKLVDTYIYIDSSILSIESYVNIHGVYVWIAIKSLLIIRSDHRNELKQYSFRLYL